MPIGVSQQKVTLIPHQPGTGPRRAMSGTSPLDYARRPAVGQLSYGAIFDEEATAGPTDPQPLAAVGETIAGHTAQQVLSFGTVRLLCGQSGRKRGELRPRILEAALCGLVRVGETGVSVRVVGQNAAGRVFIEPKGCLNVSEAGGYE